MRIQALRVLALWLLLPTLVWGQDVSPVRKKPTADAVKTAEDIVKASKAAPIVMPYGGYALVPMELAADPYVVPGSNDCLSQQTILKGKTYEGWLVSKDSPTTWKNIIIPADDKLDRILVRGIEKGTATIIWHAVVDGKSVVVDAKVFQVGEKKPDPGPTPEPTPTPVPIPGEGLRVLFVYETKDLSNLPSAQVQSLTAKEVLDYLDSHCLKVDGQPEYRKLDPNTDMSKASEIWQAAMKRPRTSLPFLLISNGKTGYEGPLPANTAELMKLLKQYGGN